MSAAARIVTDPTVTALDHLLDRTTYEIAKGIPISRVVRELVAGLFHARRELGESWSSAVTNVCRPHPLHELVAADPFTARARAKPRGYAGDAVMIDYLYRGLTNCADRVTELGAAVFAATSTSPSAIAFRDCRDLLARRIDACADRVKRPRVLSVACGHLREAALSSAVRDGKLGLLTALDQDADSLAVVRDDHRERAEIVPVHASVRNLLRGKLEVCGYDLIYATGLYDYLPDPLARDLTRLLVQGLAPGGELVVGNFVPDYPTIGYMEAFADWHLLCRSEADLVALLADVPQHAIASLTTHTDHSRCIAYLTLVRA